MANDVAQALGMEQGPDCGCTGRALERRGLTTTNGSMAAEVAAFDDVSGVANLLTSLHSTVTVQ